LFATVLNGSVQTNEAEELIKNAQSATDIFSQPVVIEAELKLDRYGKLTGAYRLLWESKQRWREEITLGNDYLLSIRLGDTLFVKSNSEDAEDSLEPFTLLAGYSRDLSLPKDSKVRIKDRTRQGIQLRCVLAKQGESDTEYCFQDGLYVGAPKDLEYGEFKRFLGKTYFTRWQFKTYGLKYSANVADIFRPDAIDEKYFTVDGWFRQEIEVCNARVVPPRLVSQPMPEYPESARGRVKGTVLVAIKISSTGRVSSMRVVSGPEALQQAALNAVKHYKFTPALCRKLPIRVNAAVEVDFR
jgi:TonB family protein